MPSPRPWSRRTICACSDVGHQLYPFTSGGEYGRFFTGANSIAFDANLVVLELEELKGRKHLQQVILLQLIYQIQQAMYLGERGQPKLVLIDEAWDLLTQGDVAKFIETGYRRFRKYNGAAITVTQSLATSTPTPPGGPSPRTAPTPCCWPSPPTASTSSRREHRLPLTDAGAELLKTVHTVPGAYSEIMVIGDQGAGIGRLVVDPFRRLLYSTKPADVAAIGQWRAQGLTVVEAIDRLLDAEVRDAA